MAEKKEIPKRVITSHSEYIDPLDCGSTIGYTVCIQYNRVDANVHLTDCNRRIEWGFNKDSDGEALEKIDVAIEILAKFRRDLVKAQRQFNKETANG
jgi:hypothetical protein